MTYRPRPDRPSAKDRLDLDERHQGNVGGHWKAHHTPHSRKVIAPARTPIGVRWRNRRPAATPAAPANATRTTGWSSSKRGGCERRPFAASLHRSK